MTGADLKQRINQRLRKLEITKKKFADGIGESTQTVNNWINRDDRIPLAKIEKVAAFLQCPSKLLKGESNSLDDLEDDNASIIRAYIQSEIEDVGDIKHLKGIGNIVRKMIEIEKIENEILKR